MKNLEEFKNKKIDLKSLSSVTGGATSCCEVEYDTTQVISAKYGVDHTVNYYDDNGNHNGYKFSTNLYEDCPVF